MIEQLELLPVKIARKRPTEPIIRSAEIEGVYRWVLRRAWGAGPALGVVMLNPSDADGERDDPTLWEVMKHACRLGFGSVVIANIYPFRSPSVPALRAWLADRPADAVSCNLFRAAHALERCDKIMFGWGNHADKQDVDCFLDVLVMVLCGGNADEPGPEIVFYCLGTTTSGAPKHPLARGRSRIPADQPLVPWRWGR